MIGPSASGAGLSGDFDPLHARFPLKAEGGMQQALLGKGGLSREQAALAAAQLDTQLLEAGKRGNRALVSAYLAAMESVATETRRRREMASWVAADWPLITGSVSEAANIIRVAENRNSSANGDADSLGELRFPAPTPLPVLASQQVVGVGSCQLPVRERGGVSWTYLDRGESTAAAAAAAAGASSSFAAALPSGSLLVNPKLAITEPERRRASLPWATLAAPSLATGAGGWDVANLGLMRTLDSSLGVASGSVSGRAVPMFLGGVAVLGVASSASRESAGNSPSGSSYPFLLRIALSVGSRRRVACSLGTNCV